MIRSKWMPCALLSGLVALPLTVTAGDWRVSLGGSYRGFDSVDFSATALRNYGDTNRPLGPLGMQERDPQTLFPGAPPPNLLPIPADFARFTGSSESVSSSDGFAPVVGFELALPAAGTERLCLSLVGSFQYYNVEVSENNTGSWASAGSFDAYHHKYGWLAAGGGVFTPPGLRTPGLSTGTSVFLRNEFDMDLFVLDLGIKAACKIGDKVPIEIYVALGPSLSIADVDTAQTENATWNPVANSTDPGANVPQTRTDSNVDLQPGLYGVVGVSWKFTSHMGLAAEYRYDQVFGDVGTDQGELDLSGSSGQIKLFYEF